MAPTRYPGESDEAFPEVFTKIPTQPSDVKPGQLTKEQVEQFFNNGYVVVKDYIPKEMLDACRKAIEDLVEELAQKLYKGGKIKDLYADAGFFERLTLLEKEFPGANIMLHKYGHLPQAFRDLWTSPMLLNAMEQLLGTSDIVGHPVWNLRTKTPQNEATTVPWHQDSGYLDNDSYSVLQPTAWIPLVDATEKNGCMQVVKDGHRPGKICQHTGCYGNTWYVMLSEEEIQKTLGSDMSRDVITCEVPYGGMLLLNNMIPHRSLNNLSDQIRWSLDLRWQRADLPVGFYGLKDGIRMRSSTDPEFKVYWEEWDKVDRQAIQTENTAAKSSESEFDTIICGPWMKKWEIVNHNRHTRVMEKEGGDSLSWHP